MLSRARRKFIRNWRDFGLTAALGKAVMELFGFVYYEKEYRIYRKLIAGGTPPARCPEGLRFTLVGAGDDDLISQIEMMEEWLTGKVKGMLAAGGVCVAVMDGSRVAGFNVATFDQMQMPLVRTSRRMRSGQAWSEQITVNPDYRGKGIATILRKRMFQELAAKGIRVFYGGTLTSNKANLALTRKVGFEEVADICYRKVCRMERWRVKRVHREQ